jgi:Cysteine-rich CPXCG
MRTDDELTWVCQYCGVRNYVWVDLTIDGKQDFVEDCRICYQPNRIIITIDNYVQSVEEDNTVVIESRPSDE